MMRARLLLLLLAAATACKRNPAPKTEHITQTEDVTDRGERLFPGPERAIRTSLPSRALPISNPLQGDRKAIQEGRRLYYWMNCKGCHGEGGGGIGPTLWDEQWRYGGRGIDIAESILHGRPDGMPAFSGQLPEAEVWKVVAYVQSLAPRGGPFEAGRK